MQLFWTEDGELIVQSPTRSASSCDGCYFYNDEMDCLRGYEEKEAAPCSEDYEDLSHQDGYDTRFYIFKRLKRRGYE